MAEILISNTYDIITFDSECYNPRSQDYSDITPKKKDLAEIGKLIKSLRGMIYEKTHGNKQIFGYQNGVVAKENLVEAIKAQSNFKQKRLLQEFDIATFELLDSLIAQLRTLSTSDTDVLIAFIRHGFPQSFDDCDKLYYLFQDRYDKDPQLMIGLLSAVVDKCSQMMNFSLAEHQMNLMSQEEWTNAFEPYVELPYHITLRDIIRSIVEKGEEDEDFKKLPAAWQIELLTNDSVEEIFDIASDETLENKVRQC